MKTKSYFKAEPKTRFTVKSIRGGYFAVVNNYDMSFETICITKFNLK